MIDRMTRRMALMLACFALAAPARAVAQEAVTIEMTVKDQLFQPSEIRAPANRPIVLRIRNLDAKPMEFESIPLRVEKVVPAHGSGTINLRPLKTGRYSFFNDFYAKAKGVLIVE